MKDNAKKSYNAQVPTVAWLKYMEILQIEAVKNYILGLNMNVLNVFCNAEFPGSGLSAINHFIRMNNRQMNWLISSYYPQPGEESSISNALSDKYGLVRNYPQNVIVGPIIEYQSAEGTTVTRWNNGDLTNPIIPDILSDIVNSTIGKVNLYTSDGGFNIGNNYNEQEILSIPLKYGEARTGVLTLAKEGVMILKIFTFFTPFMKSLLYCLAESFEDWMIVKPMTSSPINSEAYFVGINFKGSENWRKNEPTSLEVNNKWYSPEAKTLSQIEEYLELFSNTQMKIIGEFSETQNILQPSEKYPFPEKLSNSYALKLEGDDSSKSKKKELLVKKSH